MKIGIVGSAERAVAWEQNLRPHPSISEVTIAPTLKDLGTTDACIIIDDSETKLETLLNSVKLGFHSFLISRLPRDINKIEKIHHVSQEAGVTVQFSHWPTLAPASQWMSQKIPKPRFIQIVREIRHTDFLERDMEFADYWLDELAFCIKWMNAGVHQVEVQQTDFAAKNGGAIHFFLRFENGATAGIYITTIASSNSHKRIASDHSYILNCNVLEQTVRVGKNNNDGHLFFTKKMFEASKSAELATLKFLKGIQLKQNSTFGAYDLFRTLKVSEKINKKL